MVLLTALKLCNAALEKTDSEFRLQTHFSKNHCAQHAMIQYGSTGRACFSGFRLWHLTSVQVISVITPPKGHLFTNSFMLLYIPHGSLGNELSYFIFTV